ncbi:hypothetical protein [Desulfobaculum bizertense]|uniref:hypothetical protein n=1 Tax=Desulfobaculum bizertense TaxID=376490 RepID=UPI00117FA65B|nr:hypothetical protein [Desulfobaculum bizertense]
MMLTSFLCRIILFGGDFSRKHIWFEIHKAVLFCGMKESSLLMVRGGAVFFAFLLRAKAEEPLQELGIKGNTLNLENGHSFAMHSGKEAQRKILQEKCRFALEKSAHASFNAFRAISLSYGEKEKIAVGICYVRKCSRGEENFRKRKYFF